MFHIVGTIIVNNRKKRLYLIGHKHANAKFKI